MAHIAMVRLFLGCIGLLEIHCLGTAAAAAVGREGIKIIAGFIAGCRFAA